MRYGILGPVAAIINERIERMGNCQNSIGNLVVPIVSPDDDLVSLIGMPGRIVRAVVC